MQTLSPPSDLDNGCSPAITIPGGFPFGGHEETEVYVSQRRNVMTSSDCYHGNPHLLETCLFNPLNTEPVFVVLRYMHQRMSITTNAVTYAWKPKYRKIMKNHYPISLKPVLYLINDSNCVKTWNWHKPDGPFYSQSIVWSSANAPLQLQPGNLGCGLLSRPASSTSFYGRTAVSLGSIPLPLFHFLELAS